MPNNDEDVVPDPDHDGTECTPGNPCCYTLELGVKMALTLDIFVCLVAIGGCAACGALQIRLKETELNKATKRSRMSLIGSFSAPIGFLFLSIVSSGVLLCNRKFWACMMWLATKASLLLVAAIILRNIYLETVAFNEAVAGVGPNYSKHHRDIKGILAGVCSIGAFLFILGVWFMWAVGAYARYIRRNLILPRNARTVLEEETQDTRALGHILDEWEENTKIQRPYEVLPARVRRD